MTNEIAQFNEVLKSFEKIPPAKKYLRSYLEIAGFPSYENVISNILAYYFTVEEEHQLGDLFVRSLLSKIGLPDEPTAFSEVVREETTPENKRIDIVIHTEKYVIGIENKIYAPLYNDLNIYAQHLQKLANESGKTPQNVVLSPFLLPKSNAQFYFLSYADLFTEIRVRLGNYIQNVPLDALSLLRDFMAGIEKLYISPMANSDLNKFLAENEVKIEKLLNTYQQEQGRFANEVVQVRQILTGHLNTTNRTIQQGIYRKIYLYHFITLLPEELVFCAEVVRRFSGWHFNVYVSSKKYGVFWKPEILERLDFPKIDLEKQRVSDNTSIDFNKVRIEVLDTRDFEKVAKKMDEILACIQLKR